MTVTTCMMFLMLSLISGVWPAGSNDSLKVSNAPAPFTVTLKQPSGKEMFSNNQAKLECVITGQDQTIVNEIQIMWEIDGVNVADHVTGTTVSKDGQHSRTSTMTRSRTEWLGVNKVRCSASTNNMTPVFEDLIVHKGGGSEPKVTLHVLSDKIFDQGGSAKVTLVCLVSSRAQQDFYIAWSEYDGGKTDTYIDGINFPPEKSQDGYLVTSVYTTNNWGTHKFECNVWPAGSNDAVKVAVSSAPAPFTVTLKQPSGKEMFSNNQAKLECVITGQDQTIVNEIQITWEIDGVIVTDRVTGTTVSKDGQHSKTSTMTRSRTEWEKVNKVRCSASTNDMTRVFEDLIVHRGDGSEPKLTVHVLPQEVINKGESANVTLVCLVSSRVQQDFYIAWSEHKGQQTGNYIDGINFPPQKSQDGYLVTSVYTTTNWGTHKFECNVWPAGSNKTMRQEVFSVQGNSLECDK